MLKTLIAVAALAAGATASAETYAVQAGRLIVDAAQPVRGASTVIVEDGPALTSGAVSSAFDLSLRLVERRCGARLARATGKLALLHAPRASQQPYTDRSLMPAAATPFAVYWAP